MAKTRKDFGQKIGGARKDLYSSSLSVPDLEHMNEAERAKYVRRDSIWPRPDAKKQIAVQGLSQATAFWQNLIRVNLRPAPLFSAPKTQEDYIRTVEQIRDRINAVTKEEEIPSVLDWLEETFLEHHRYYTLIREDTGSAVRAELFRRRNFDLPYLKAQAKYRQYGEPKTDNKQKARKGRFPIPALAGVVRSGPDYLSWKHADPQMFLDLGIKGGEFGNWMSDADAESSLDHCYLAFRDLSDILGIEPPDISLNHTLSIAFGARGHSSAAAHYEPLRQVINLTKFKGMGCLGHEWAHALDDYIGRSCGLEMTESGSFASRKYKRTEIPSSFRLLMDKLLWKKTMLSDGLTTVNTASEYLKGSREFDRIFSKAGHGYYADPCEMFARAFDCYLSDKLKSAGIQSPYLTSHADCFRIKRNGETVSAIPEGPERAAINCCFDRLLTDLKERGLLHPMDKAPVQTNVLSLSDIKAIVAAKKNESGGQAYHDSASNALKNVSHR